MKRSVGEAVNLKTQEDVDFANLADWQHYPEFEHSVRIQKETLEETTEFVKDEMTKTTEPVKKQYERELWIVGSPEIAVPAVDVKDFKILRFLTDERIQPVSNKNFNKLYEVEKEQDKEKPEPKPQKHEAKPKQEEAPAPKPKKK